MDEAWTRWRDSRPEGALPTDTVVVSRIAPDGDWTRAVELPAWATGPDPFVEAQDALYVTDARHEALAERLAAGRRAAVRTWSGTDEPPPGPLPSRSAAWLGWRLDEPGARLEARQVVDPSDCRGWILLAHHPLQIRILDLQASDREAHYDLLKAARRRSWERGGVPVVLHGERMSRRYAFTAGYLPAPSTLSLWVRPGASAPASAWEADA